MSDDDRILWELKHSSPKKRVFAVIKLAMLAIYVAFAVGLLLVYDGILGLKERVKGI